MRTKLLGLMLGCTLAAATLAPALACPYQTQASSNDAPPQQTAQAQSTAPTNTQ